MTKTKEAAAERAERFNIIDRASALYGSCEEDRHISLSPMSAVLSTPEGHWVQAWCYVPPMPAGKSPTRLCPLCSLKILSGGDCLACSTRNDSPL